MWSSSHRALTLLPTKGVTYMTFFLNLGMFVTRNLQKVVEGTLCGIQGRIKEGGASTFVSQPRDAM